MVRLGILCLATLSTTAATVYGRVGTVPVEKCAKNADKVYVCAVVKVEQTKNTVTVAVVRSLKGTPGKTRVIQGRVYGCKPVPLSYVMKAGQRYLVFEGKRQIPSVYVLKVDKEHFVHLGVYTRGFRGVVAKDSGDPILQLDEAVKQVNAILR